MENENVRQYFEKLSKDNRNVFEKKFPGNEYFITPTKLATELLNVSDPIPDKMVFRATGISRFFNKRKDEMILTKNGFSVNDIGFQWDQIQSTHLIYIETPSSMIIDESYILVEPKIGRIQKVDIMNVEFSSIWPKLNENFELVLGHFIELYKQHSTEKTRG